MNRSRLPDRDAARCWGCGYLLRGVGERGRCPECGREFDVTDLKSVNFGRPMGALGRRALADVGPGGMRLAVVAFLLVLATTRWPVAGWHFSFLDLNYYGGFWWWWGRGDRPSATDAAYTIGIWTYLVVLGLHSLRLVWGALAVARYRPPPAQRGRWGRRTLAIVLLGVGCVAGVGVGWPYRMGQRWVTLELRTPPSAAVWPWARGASVPMVLRKFDDQSVALRSALRHGWTATDRICALKLLIETHGWKETLPVLTEALARERDARARAIETRVLALSCMRGSLETLLSLATNDPDVEVRAAALDGLAIWHRPIWPLSTKPAAQEVEIDCQPAIHVPFKWFDDTPPADLSARVRGVLERAMLQGATQAEREAGARGLVDWTAVGAHLRYAEWGVFEANAAGEMLVTKVRDRLAEIPAFAHRVPGIENELSGRLDASTPPMNVWKPVIHLTANTAMAVDVQATLLEGRPWVAYPAFDDLALTPRPLKAFTGRMLPAPASDMILDRPLDPAFAATLGEGYPWLSSRHRHYVTNRSSLPTWRITTTVPVPRVEVESAGVHWQNVIVTPQRQGGMSVADVGPEARFAWWKRLRDVNSSWVTSRGETERFLYYDGPVGVTAPMRVAIEDGRLHRWRLWYPATPTASPPPNHGAHVVVADDGRVTMTWSTDDGWLELDPPSPKRTVEAAEAEFTAALEREGLTPSEAAGLVACWRDVFFHTPGRRYLLLMSAAEYDELCPLTVRPTPDERVRVGVIWTELSER